MRELKLTNPEGELVLRSHDDGGVEIEIPARIMWNGWKWVDAPEQNYQLSSAEVAMVRDLLTGEPES